jgi:hypothetical protein
METQLSQIGVMAVAGSETLKQANQPGEAEFYLEKIQPRLAGVSTSAIASWIGVGRWYAGRIRQGYRPHPRHWQALAELVKFQHQLGQSTESQ